MMTVENKLLDILRCLEKLFGNLDNLDIDIDAMNLEYPNFRVEKAEKAYENKISDYKIDLMKDMIEFFEDECRTKVNENVSFLKEHYEEESRDSATEEIVTFKKKEIWDTNACQECILSYHF